MYNQKQTKKGKAKICLVCVLYTTVNLNSNYMQIWNMVNQHCMSSYIYVFV
jgi:hypothetical protein